MNILSVEVKNPDSKTTYPWVSSLFQEGFSLDFSNITIIVGENGVGKSTLLEAIAYSIGFPLTGGGVNHAQIYNDLSRVMNHYGRRSLQTLSEEMADNSIKDFKIDSTLLADNLKLKWRYKNTKGMFLRAETFATTINLPKYSGASTMSHGEGIVGIAETIADDGIYIFDEPESGLSPYKIVEFMAVLQNKVRNFNSQFIISTHSPLLMLIPNAKVVQITQNSIHEVDPTTTSHFTLTKRILNNPKDFIDRYFSVDD